MSKDLISRQEAIEDVKSWVAVDGREKHLQKDVIEWLKEFPPAQPEKRTEERTETHGVCLDAIDRQVAIDTLHDEIVRRRINEDSIDDGALDEFDTEAILRRLPSAQPEIIRCKGCKHQVKEWRTDKRLKDKGYMVCGCDVVGDACGFWALLGQDDDYCSHAERKTDEDD